MATFSDARAVYGLSAVGTPTSTNISGTVTVGTGQTQVRLTGANVAYSLRAVFLGGSSDLVLDLLENDTTGSTAHVAGTRQVETATVVAASGITGNGNAEVIVTGAGITGSPVTVTVPVTTALNTASLLGAALRAGVSANAAITELYDVSGTGADIVLTRKATDTYTPGTLSFPIYAANDATLNIATQNGTCTGITTAATSTNTTAGVATSGVVIYDGDGLDVEGVDIPTLNIISGLLIQNDAGGSQVVVSGVTASWSIARGTTCLWANDDIPGTAVSENTLTFSSSDITDLLITVVGIY